MSQIESLEVDGAGVGIAPATRAAVMLQHPVAAVAVTEGGRIRETNAAWQALFALPSDVSVESHVATLFANISGADRFERQLQTQCKSAGAKRRPAPSPRNTR